jgi:hypothetical protein
MQLTFGDAEDLGQRKQTRRELFLAEMEQVVVELTRFSGHLIVGFGGVHHGRQDGSIRAGV